MEKVRIVIAEDDASSRKVLRRFLEVLPYTEVVAETGDGEELLHTILTEEPNLVLLDIHMPRLNGIHAIKECLKVLPQLKTIFISGYSEYAVDAFDLSAVDYLVKPVERARLFQAVDKARGLIKLKNENEWSEFPKLKSRVEKIVVQAEGMIHFLPVDDIYFTEKVGRKTSIHTVHKKVEVFETLGALFKRLDPAVFFQTHRSYIVNFGRISRIKPSGETNLVYFDDYAEPAYISKNRMHELLKYLKRLDE